MRTACMGGGGAAPNAGGAAPNAGGGGGPPWDRPNEAAPAGGGAAAGLGDLGIAIAIEDRTTPARVAAAPPPPTAFGAVPTIDQPAGAFTGTARVSG